MTDALDNLTVFLDRVITCVADKINRYCNCFSQRLINTYDRLNELEQEISRSPVDDLRDIANSLSIPSGNVDLNVKIRLNIYGIIDRVCVKYPGSDQYHKVPFDIDRNPEYIQEVLDDWFIYDHGGFCAISKLYDELEYDFGDIEKGITRIWLINNVDWIKFTKLNGKMYPSGYKECFDEELSDPDTSDDIN